MKQPYAALSREYVLAHNPQIVVITGSIWQGAHDTDQMRMGLSVSPEEAQSRLHGFAARPEWKTLKPSKPERSMALTTVLFAPWLTTRI